MFDPANGIPEHPNTASLDPRAKDAADLPPVIASSSFRDVVASGAALIVWIVAFTYLKLRPDQLLHAKYFLFSDGGQYLWVIDRLRHGRHLFTEVHWYYGVIPLWACQGFAGALGNSAGTFATYTLTCMALNVGLACWWLSRLMTLRWAVAGVLLSLAPWLVRNIVTPIHVPWEITALLLLAIAWKPMGERGVMRQIGLGALIVSMLMIKIPMFVAGAVTLFATDFVMEFRTDKIGRIARNFIRHYWATVLTCVLGLGLFLAWMWWMTAGDAGIWFDTVLPLYQLTAYAASSMPPIWLDWRGVPFLLFNQLPLATAITGTIGLVAWALRRRDWKRQTWIAGGGMFMPLALLLSPLSVVRITAHFYQYSWMGFISLAICLPLLPKRTRLGAVALLLFFACALPYKMFSQPNNLTRHSLPNGQALWFAEEESSKWAGIYNAWQTHMEEGRKSMLVLLIGAGSNFYGNIPQNFRQYYYYPGFIRRYDLDWLAAHQGEFCGAVVTGNPKQLDALAMGPTEQAMLYLDPGWREDRIKIGTPDRVGETCLFLPFVPEKKPTEK